MFIDEFIRPLQSIENKFLEVLVNEFELTKNPTGVKLSLQIDDDTPAIWNDLGRNIVRSKIPKFDKKSRKYQDMIDSFWRDPAQRQFAFKKQKFPFRYSSGGTVPLIRFRGELYYCLIYRECFPVGWNIANGGSDNRQEMLNPFITVERELREELLIVDFKKEQRYVIDLDSDNPEDMPEHIQARCLWSEYLALPKQLIDYSRVLTPTKWLDGPDALHVKVGEKENRLTGCFLNINALDFGIEIDRIAKICVDDDACFLDGEILNGRLVGAPVGLFKADRIHQMMNCSKDISTSGKVIPDLFFFDGHEYEGSEEELMRILEDRYVPHIEQLVGHWDSSQWYDNPDKLIFCPVTKNILQRAACAYDAQSIISDDYEVFISFATEDQVLAGTIKNFLEENTNRKTFFSLNLDKTNYAEEIDHAIHSASSLISVASNPEYLQKRWTQYEYRAFHVLMLNGRKTRGSNILSFVSGFDPHELPLPLNYYQAITSMNEILKYIN